MFTISIFVLLICAVFIALVLQRIEKAHPKLNFHVHKIITAALFLAGLLIGKML